MNHEMGVPLRCWMIQQPGQCWQKEHTMIGDSVLETAWCWALTTWRISVMKSAIDRSET